jgi:hypothetical protein
VTISVLALIALANIVVWGIIIGLMFRLESGERDVSASLTDLEERLGDH